MGIKSSLLRIPYSQSFSRLLPHHLPVEEQVAIIYAGINGFLDDVPVSDVKEFVGKLRSYIAFIASTVV